jgi:galactose-1-phosphate uridylyltransferase
MNNQKRLNIQTVLDLEFFIKDNRYSKTAKFTAFKAFLKDVPFTTLQVSSDANDVYVKDTDGELIPNMLNIIQRIKADLNATSYNPEFIVFM